MSDTEDINLAIDASIPSSQDWTYLLDQLYANPDEVGKTGGNCSFWDAFSSSINSNLDGKTWHALWKQQKINAVKKSDALDKGLRKMPLNIIALKTMDLVDRFKRKQGRGTQEQDSYQNFDIVPQKLPVQNVPMNDDRDSLEDSEESLETNSLKDFLVQAKDRIRFGSVINVEDNYYGDIFHAWKKENEALCFSQTVNFEQCANTFADEIFAFVQNLLSLPEVRQ